MITEQYKDKVYFSKLLCTDCPNIYKDICEILDANNVAHETLSLTKDYWCRDYMPVQYASERFSQFVYNPDYLKGKEKYITNADKVMKKIEGNNFIVNHSSLVIDGGNIVIGEIGLPNSYTTQSFIVMTDKVMRENEGLSQKEIETQIQDSFKPKECNSDYDDITIVWLPWDPKDICGHTDGILRFVDINKDGKAVVLANLSVYDDDIATRMRNILMEHFYVIELKLSEYHELSWAYVNALQTRDVIIVPGIGNAKLDNEAMGQFIALYPDYKGRIYQVQMKDFIKKWGGALNCCTWTVSEDMSKIHHNTENDKEVNSFFYDLIHSHAQTKLKGDVWGYIKALNSIHMEYIGTKTDYIYHGSSLAPSYTPVTRNLYKGVNNNGVIFKSLQINGQIYKNNSGNTYTNP